MALSPRTGNTQIEAGMVEYTTAEDANHYIHLQVVVEIFAKSLFWGQACHFRNPDWNLPCVI